METVREDINSREKSLQSELHSGPSEILDGARLNGVSLDNLSDLDGCWFRRADLRDIHLSEGSCRNARFADADCSDGWLRGTDFTAASFSQTNLREATLKDAILTDCNLKDALLERTNLLGATLSDVLLDGAILNNVRLNERTEFHSHHQPEKRWDGIRTSRPLSAHDPKLSRSDSHPYDDDSDRDIVSPRKAVYVYTQLAESANANSLTTLDQQFHIRAQDARLNHLRNQKSRLRALTLRISRTIFLYGESLMRVGVLSGLTIICSALLYLLPLVGGVSGGQVTYPHRNATLARNFGELLYFSTVTFSTVGFGNFHPAGDGAQAIAAAESIAGAVLTALFVFVLGRRAQR